MPFDIDPIYVIYLFVALAAGLFDGDADGRRGRGDPECGERGMSDRVISEAAFARLRELRAFDPEAIRHAVATRTRRHLDSGDGRLFIVAADHPARGALAVGSDATAMADRYELIERLAIALSRPGVDGVLVARTDDASSAVGAVIAALDAAGIRFGQVAASHPSLDDVYLHFVGHTFDPSTSSGTGGSPVFTEGEAA